MKYRLAALIAAFACLLGTLPALAQQGKVDVLWLGQSTFRITTPGGKVIVTDPWLRPNPITPPEFKNLAALGKVDVILVSHGHGDHIADAPDLAILNDIPIYAPGDLNQVLTTLGVLPAAKLPRFNKGGTIRPAEGIKVTAVHAEHSSVYVWKNPATAKDEAHYGGEPIGFIIELENGFKIYHMGDTDVFGDMRLIAERHRPDLILIPIGGNFTMDPVGAAYATRELLKPKYAIPMHYGTNPLNRGTPQEYTEALGRTTTQVIPMKPGEAVKF